MSNDVDPLRTMVSAPGFLKLFLCRCLYVSMIVNYQNFHGFRLLSRFLIFMIIYEVLYVQCLNNIYTHALRSLRIL